VHYPLAARENANHFFAAELIAPNNRGFPLFSYVAPVENLDLHFD
jgi:hypothetical protein